MKYRQMTPLQDGSFRPRSLIDAQSCSWNKPSLVEVHLAEQRRACHATPDEGAELFVQQTRERRCRRKESCSSATCPGHFLGPGGGRWLTFARHIDKRGMKTLFLNFKLVFDAFDNRI